VHPAVMHISAVNITNNRKILDAMSRSFKLYIGTFPVKFMQKLCKKDGAKLLFEISNG
jgi:hypothetical protein